WSSTMRQVMSPPVDTRARFYDRARLPKVASAGIVRLLVKIVAAKTSCEANERPTSAEYPQAKAKRPHVSGAAKAGKAGIDDGNRLRSSDPSACRFRRISVIPPPRTRLPPT